MLNNEEQPRICHKQMRGKLYKELSLFFKKHLINYLRACIKTKKRFRGIAQLVEHRSPKPSVVSSNLTAPAIKKPTRVVGFFMAVRGS